MKIDTTGLTKQEIENIESACNKFNLANKSIEQIKELVKELDNNMFDLYTKACDAEVLVESVQQYLNIREKEENS